ncbi:hypothetical protein [Marinicella rhabdoformis]|uniref:hypothetical protein n=1 Tax=Marinicella rhabdoformis TaxID=2580566 RepID=UPI0012AEBA06|nr:hypothetical protein [Marinicella rhabdoformis]
MFEKLTAAYQKFWNKLDALAAKDPHLLKHEPIRVVHTKDGKLKILLGCLSEKVFITVFFTLFFSVFILVSIISMERHAPSEFFLSWKFFVATTAYLLMLLYNWTQGFVIFDNIRETVCIKDKQYKFLGEKHIDFHNINGWHINVHTVYLKLNSNECITLFSVSNDMKGKEIKKSIEIYTGKVLVPHRKNKRKW